MKVLQGASTGEIVRHCLVFTYGSDQTLRSDHDHLLGYDDANPWRRWIDTSQETPNDIVPWEEAPAFQGLTYRAEARSVVVLYAYGRQTQLGL